ncbi:aminoglycoside phosphotransferase family protein [Phenylobacterium sp.]|uniref:aminoglycoside phosphotransferase family protein n=1 Tax=Phenylobacterium sp. TaxID=1871053 RepID=UPI002D80A1BD|nr:aminoglycoside phosphotransferase family protein [Phenylobacterium sp.]
MTAEKNDPFVPRLLSAMAQAGAGPRGQGPLSLVHSRVTARSRLYFLGDGRHLPELVAKVPITDAPSEHPPLDAAAQYEALRRSHGWFQGDDRHAVAEPVACLADMGAFVMRHAAGPTVAGALSAAPRDPTAALRAARAAGDFLRRFHDHGAAGYAEIGLQDLVRELERDAAEVLSPLRRSLPPAVVAAIRRTPRAWLSARRVVRHGDYVGANLIVTGPAGVTMIDPAMSDVGLPEDDAARFVAHLAATSAFVPGVVWPPLARLRRRLQEAFLAGYGPLPNPPEVFYLRLLRQHALRWARRTELMMARRHGPRMPVQRLVNDWHMQGLLHEAGGRLSHSLRGGGQGA